MQHMSSNEHSEHKSDFGEANLKKLHKKTTSHSLQFEKEQKND